MPHFLESICKGRQKRRGGALRVLHQGRNAYTQSYSISAAAGEYAARAAIARDGSTLAVGWWDILDANDATARQYLLRSDRRLEV